MPRTTAHDHKQLAEVLNWSAVQVDKAVVLGVLPAYDLRPPRWKGATVDELAARRDNLTAALDETALLTDSEMMQVLGMEWPQWRRGCDHGIIPSPDQGAFWSRALASDLAGQAVLLREQIPPQPLGAGRCITMLCELTGLEVADADFTKLVEEDVIPCVGDYKGWALYDVAVVQRLGATEDGKAIVTATVTERVAWLEASFTTKEAAGWLDWDPADFKRVTSEQGITPGRFERWARKDVYRLEADRELTDRVRRARLLGPDQAAKWMKIRRTDFALLTGLAA